jgi:signal transduction histidine kinase
MRRSEKILLAFCIFSVGSFIFLQALWLRNYSDISRDRFRKDVDLAFDEAIREEFRDRCDTLEALLTQYLLDTTRVRFTSTWNKRYQQYSYALVTTDSGFERYNFSHRLFNRAVTNEIDSNYRRLAQLHARSYRQENLEKRIVYYHTQALGAFIGKEADRWQFDTARLRPFVFRTLKAKQINEDFYFTYTDSASKVANNAGIAAISPAYESYRLEPTQAYVQLWLPSMRQYVNRRLAVMWFLSVFVLMAVGISVYLLFRSLQRQKKLSSMKSDFISNITHELQTPLATLSAALELLENFGAENDKEKRRKYLQITRSELNRLKLMTQQVLDASMYEKEDFVLNRKPFSIEAFLQQIIEKRQWQNNVEIQIEYEGDHQKTVCADPIWLENAVGNLLDNSIKYGGKNVRIVLRTVVNKRLLIEVEDNGPGISANYLPFVFDRFFRVPRGNQHPVKGKGIGLYLVKKIAELHGGSCRIRSREGKGTCVSIELPNLSYDS